MREYVDQVTVEANSVTCREASVGWLASYCLRHTYPAAVAGARPTTRQLQPGSSKPASFNVQTHKHHRPLFTQSRQHPGSIVLPEATTHTTQTTIARSLHNQQDADQVSAAGIAASTSIPRHTPTWKRRG